MLSKNVKKFVPNFITLLNLFLGFVTIVLLTLAFSSDNYNYIRSNGFAFVMSNTDDFGISYGTCELF